MVNLVDEKQNCPVKISCELLANAVRGKFASIF